MVVYHGFCWRVTVHLLICEDDHRWARVCHLHDRFRLLLTLMRRPLTSCQVSGSSSKLSLFHCRNSSSFSALLRLSKVNVCWGPAGSSGASVWVCASAQLTGFLLLTSVLWRLSLTILPSPPMSTQLICSASSSTFQQPFLHH